MASWTVNVELNYNGEPWSSKKVILWSRWSGWPFDAWSALEEFTDDSGHAVFEVEDDSDTLDDDTPIAFRVTLNGEDFDSEEYTLGGGAFTFNVDTDDDDDEEDDDNEDDSEDEADD